MEVSVIVPSYKPKEYIFQCLDSLKNQTLDKELFEVIIVLNGEKDPYYDNIKKWICENNLKNFELLYSKITGVSNARNIALDFSKGEYIVFVDDDDYIDKNYIEELLTTNKKIGFDSIVVTDYINFQDETNKILFKTKYFFEKGSLVEARKVFSMACIKIIPKNIISRIRFNTKYKNGEDSLFMLKISKNIKSVKKVEKETFYWRRVRKDSAHFRKKDSKKIIKNTLFLIKDFSKLFFEKGYNKRFIFIRILAVLKGMIYQFKN